ncbi:MAG: outer membrane protein TolC [Cyclobacteriaceae bacterium]|jgi:outer membrane protein TolC
MSNRTVTFLLLCLSTQVTVAQQLLTKQEAIAFALASNFNIVQANQSVLIEENNTSIYNSGYLPTLSGNANINYNTDDITAEFQDGRDVALANAESDSRTAGLAFNWVLFDGFNRKYSMSRNQASYTVSQLNARATLEVVLLDLFNAYYEVARTQKTVQSLETTLDISKDRLVRSEYGFDYGQNTKLDVSNAQVDVNTDNINLLNARQSLANANRNLNFILARDANTIFAVDTTLTFSPLENKDAMKVKLMENNTQIRLANAGLIVSNYNTRVSSSRYLPTLALNSNYNYRLGNNNSASFLSTNTSSGISYGATLSWNIFDGGGTRTAVQNARINAAVQETTMKQATQQEILNFENAWSDYQNRLFVVTAQESNLAANRQNFGRTSEQYKLGQVISLDFRTAQRNLLQAEINLVEARYNAKIAELSIYQLVGDVQQAEF